MLSEIYLGCMLIGNRFMHKYSIEETDDWRGSEECSTIARLTYELMNTMNIGMERALDIVMKIATDKGFRNVEDHMWDDYCRGFLAGELIGGPTGKNIKKAELAEKIWAADKNGKYGYYQEILNEVTREV